jgi:hypothetical protein
MSKFLRYANIFLRYIEIEINLPFISYKISPDELVSRESVDTRIAKLEKVRSDLLDAVDAVKSLEAEAHKNKDELIQLSEQLSTLKQDKETTEALLKLPQDSFARVLDNASKGAQWKGLVIGFFLGILASLIATWIWDKTHMLDKQQIDVIPNQKPIQKEEIL